MDRERIDELVVVYRDGLLDDVIPFWLRHGVDREHGGFFSALDRDGSIIDTDKAMWMQGRFTWLLATLCLEVERRDEWLDAARHGVEFIRKRGFDDDGRMWFHVTRDGAPIRKRRYVFTECFAAIALAAYARASGEERAAEEAGELLRVIERHLQTPGLIKPKHVPGTRPMKAIGPPMILLNLAQVFRRTIDHASAEPLIDACIDEIRQHFVKPDLEVVMENVGPNGEILDHFDGRLLNPGHAIEAAWFILEEGRIRRADDLVALGAHMLDWMWVRGWDTEYGGLLYFRDLHDKPVQEYWHDMKFWWPHAETLIATQLAYELTGAQRYASMFEDVHAWTWKHFPDPEYGEWYGYLHRDGRISVPLKGNMWKGPFHIPRMLLRVWKGLERMRDDRNGAGEGR